MSADRPAVERVRRIAAILVVAVGVIGYLVIDSRIGASEDAIQADRCSKGREESVACKAQTCRRLAAVTRPSAQNELRHLLRCDQIERQLAQRRGAEEAAALGAPSSTSTGGGRSTQPETGEAPGGAAPGPDDTPGNSPASPPGQAKKPVEVQTPDLPVVGKPSVCVGNLVGVNC